ncbi:glycosyltransferase [Candidatus Poribacteria bacterium]|nr:glycosyltransferase [Candidatus Poribacteria bacterium]
MKNNKTTSNCPLVTVNILTWNRKADLEKLLNILWKQSYHNLEIIVVDNASEDGTAQMIEQCFPEVRLFKLSQNIGIQGWNVGFEKAKGDYVLTLDDDCFPEADSIRKMVGRFQHQPETGIIAFRILDRDTGENWNSMYTPAADAEIEWFTFAGCAVGFRTHLIKQVLFPNIFLYEHELEPSIRILDMGYRIKLCPDIKAYHKMPEISRQSWKSAYYSTRNDLIFAWKCLPFITCLKLSLGIIILHGCIAIKHRRLSAYIRALFYAAKMLPQTISEREVVGESAVKSFKPFIQSKKLFTGIRKRVRTG